MIREATKHDKTQIFEMLREFRKESAVPQFQTLENETTVDNLITSIIVGRGRIFLDDNKGLLIGLITPSVWCSRTYVLHELAWYVKPEYRHTRVGYRLLRAYIDYGRRLKDEGRISYFTVSKMDTSPNINYGKFGFTKIEENWIQ